MLKVKKTQFDDFLDVVGVFDLDGGVGGEDLGDHLVGVLPGGADLHETDAVVVEEKVAEFAFLVLVVGGRRQARDAKRIFLLLAEGNRVRFVVEGIST